MITTHTFPVLRMLQDGEFHSGAVLARALGVSRGTVWNAVRALGDAGLDVYHVRGRGYRLAEPLRTLDDEAIIGRVGREASRFHVEVVDIADSTNTLLMQRAATAENGTVLAAEWQQRGRGRMERPWHAPVGGAITFSLLWRFKQGAAALAGLSLAVGVALARALKRLGVSGVQLKWPNDVVWRGRKLAGVLIEMHGDTLGPSTVVIGIGINARLTPAVRQRIDQPVVDLETACGSSVDRNAVLGEVLAQLATVLDVFSSKGFQSLRDEWQRYNAHRGQRVTVERPGGRTARGIVRGVADDGALLFETASTVTPLHSAEIRMRAVGTRRSANAPASTRPRSRS